MRGLLIAAPAVLAGKAARDTDELRRRANPDGFIPNRQRIFSTIVTMFNADWIPSDFDRFVQVRCFCLDLLRDFRGQTTSV